MLRRDIEQVLPERCSKPTVNGHPWNSTEPGQDAAKQENDGRVICWSLTFAEAANLGSASRTTRDSGWGQKRVGRALISTTDLSSRAVITRLTIDRLPASHSAISLCEIGPTTREPPGRATARELSSQTTRP